MEQVRPVAVEAHPLRVDLVIGVAGDVRALVDHIDGVTGIGQDAGRDRPGETGTDHENG